MGDEAEAEAEDDGTDPYHNQDRLAAIGGVASDSIFQFSAPTLGLNPLNTSISEPTFWEARSIGNINMSMVDDNPPGDGIGRGRGSHLFKPSWMS